MQIPQPGEIHIPKATEWLWKAAVVRSWGLHRLGRWIRDLPNDTWQEAWKVYWVFQRNHCVGHSRIWRLWHCGALSWLTPAARRLVQFKLLSKPVIQSIQGTGHKALPTFSLGLPGAASLEQKKPWSLEETPSNSVAFSIKEGFPYKSLLEKEIWEVYSSCHDFLFLTFWLEIPEL